MRTLLATLSLLAGITAVAVTPEPYKFWVAMGIFAIASYTYWERTT